MNQLNCSTPTLRVKPGQSVRFSCPLTVLGIPTDAGVLTLTLEPPVGATDLPIIDASPVHDGTGLYHSDQTIPIGATPGLWVRRWLATGSSPSQNSLSETYFHVIPLAY